MEDLERKHHLLRGLVLAVVPAILFFPALQILTISSSKYRVLLMATISATFLSSEAVAVRNLLRARTGRFDWINAMSTLGTVITMLVILATVWGILKAVIQCRDYLPFGGEILASAQNGRNGIPCYSADIGLRQKFTGKERDAESRLDYFGARYFSWAQGRLTSPDAPFADQRPEDPQSWNLYAYVRNNPLGYVDPSGRACFALNSGSPYCQRATLYGQIDTKVRGQTRRQKSLAEVP